MHNIDLGKVSLALSNTLSKKVNIIKIETVGGGYHSDAFKLTNQDGKYFFLKRIKLYDIGFELPERRLMSFLLSDGMYRRAGLFPNTIGVIVDNNKELGMIPHIDDDTIIYHIQEFQEDGVSYLSLLQGRKNKVLLDEEDILELESITDLITKIHCIKHPAKDVDKLKAVYNFGLRSILINPELTIMMLHDFGADHTIFPTSMHGMYIGLMLTLMHQWKDKHHRLVALHGDFTGANLFFKKDGSVWVIDFSRIPWGDPGVDIGWWISQYLWLYHETKNEYFKKLGERFLGIYIKKTGDKEIRQAVSLVLGLMGITFISPRFYPNLDIEIGRSFFKNVIDILKKGELIWRL